MNINCIICSDVFLPSSEIFVTPCGHLFHNACLMKWLERSKSCPQCRARATDRSVHRIYYNVPNAEGMESSDTHSLLMKVDELNCQLKIKDKEAMQANKEKNTLKINNKRAIEMMKSLEETIKKFETDMGVYKQQLLYHKSKSAIVEDIEAENKRLKERIEQLNLVDAIVKASANEADRMINKQTSTKDMVTLLSVIKRELVSSESRRKEMQRQMKRLQMDLVNAKTQQNKLKEQGDATRQLEADLRRSDREKNNAVRRLRILESELGKKKEHQQSQRRSMSVSPRHVLTCPSVPRANSEMDLSIKSPRALSPTVPERVHDIQSSKSPYLQVQASSVGIMPLRTLQPKARITKHPLNDAKEDKFSIFKKPRIQITKPRQEQFTFDGLGGQSKLCANNTKPANGKRPANLK